MATIQDPFGMLERAADKGSEVIWMVPEFAYALIDERNRLLCEVERLTEKLTRGATK